MAIADILLICDDWIKPTKITSFTGLSFIHRGLLGLLTENGLLEEKTVGHDKNRSRLRYRATKKGIELLKETNRIYELIGITREQMHISWPDKNRSPSPSSPP